MVVLRGPGVEVELLESLHRFLSQRGWQLGKYWNIGEDGYPFDPESGWDYPGSYGGIAMNDVGDVTPYPLSCRFGFSDGLSVDVSTAGNYGGCSEHASAEHVVEVDGHCLPTDRLASLLDPLEAQASRLDPRVLLECRFFGPCGATGDND